MLRKVHFITIGFLLSFYAFAGSAILSADADNLGNRYSIIANLGYGEYKRAYHSDEQTAIGRLALAAELWTISQAAFGLEVGIQSGARMHIAQSTFETLSHAVQTTMRPMFDLLVTAQANPLDESLLFTQVKGGLVYRHWQINSILINNKNAVVGEVQAGFGYPLTEVANLSLLYQGIFGGSPKVRLNSPTETGFVSVAPMQHGILLGFSIIA
ncbi:MAG: hypothetical protein WC785_06450 [Tatlockia sp.]|jgi:hypothetical protein